MAFPPFPTQSIDGLGIYPKQPEVLDHSERGQLSGQRRDVITYVCQRTGHFDIPGAHLTWFDLDAKELRTIDFPGRHFGAAPNPDLAATVESSQTSHEQISWKTWAVMLFILLVLLGLAFYRRQLRVVLSSLIDPLRPVHLEALNPTASSPSLTSVKLNKT
jgi:hypothetical protein